MKTKQIKWPKFEVCILTGPHKGETFLYHYYLDARSKMDGLLSCGDCAIIRDLPETQIGWSVTDGS